jgi:hypothetical protein
MEVINFEESLKLKPLTWTVGEWEEMLEFEAACLEEGGQTTC